MKNIKKASLLILISVFNFTGCTQKVVEPQIIYESQPLEAGVVHYVWEEPMVDVIDIPPGLDPDGVYYRPAQKQVVEIRQGRWQYYKGPEEGKK